MNGNILIVDANVADAAEHGRILSDAGFGITIATTFEEANRIWPGVPDLVAVIADVRLRDYNGVHLAMRVRWARPSTHIIITDRTSDIVTLREAANLDMTYLVKPISPETLLTSISARLQKAAAKRPDRRWPRVTLGRDISAEIGSEPARLLDVSYGGLCFDIRSGSFGLALPEMINVAPAGANQTFMVRPIWARAGNASGRWTCGAALATDDFNSVHQWRRFVDSQIT